MGLQLFANGQANSSVVNLRAHLFRVSDDVQLSVGGSNEVTACGPICCRAEVLEKFSQCEPTYIKVFQGQTSISLPYTNIGVNETIIDWVVDIRDNNQTTIQQVTYANSASSYPFLVNFNVYGLVDVYVYARIDEDGDLSTVESYKSCCEIPAFIYPTALQPEFVSPSDYYCQCDYVCLETNYTEVELNYLTWDFGDGITQLGCVPTTTGLSCQPIVCHQYGVPGSYDVTLTYSNPVCSTQSSFTLPIQYLSAEIDFTSTKQCSNVVDFAFTGKCAQSYSWDFGDGGSSTNENPSHNYQQSGFYNVTLTITDICGSGYTTQKQVEAATGLDVSIEYDELNHCAGDDGVLLTANVHGGNGAYNYQWSTTNVNASPITTQPLSAGDNEIFVTVTESPTCFGVASVSIYGNNCCHWGDVNSFDKATASTCPIVSPNGDGTYSFDAIYSASNIYLNNHFTVDVPLVIKDFPNIYFGEGTVIEVTEGNTLVLDNSVLQGCGSLWYGIQISEAGLDCPTCADYDYNGASVIMRNGATIRDAGFGIESNNGSYYDIDGGNFIDNYMGIAVYDCSSFQGKVINSTFTANNQFLAPPLETLPPSIGIFAASVDGIEVGDATGNFNTFSNIVNGINSIASDMTVHPNMFHDLVESPDPDAEAFSSTGICAWNIFNHYVPTGSITVTGFSNDPDNNTVVNFENMERGIVLQAVDADINGNSFYLTKEIGIWAAECNNARVDMSNNRIQNAGTGIGYVTSNNVHGWVMNNRILYDNTLIPGVTGIGNRGLSVDQFNQQPLELVIAANEFQNYSRNIDLLNTGNDIYILQNQFTVKHFGNAIQAGVRAIDCNSPVIANNVFIGNTMATPNTNNPRSMAISLRNTQESQIECNEMDMTTYGMQFQQDCSTPGNPYAIRGNVFHHHWAGVEFSEFQSVHASVGDPFLNNGAIGDETNSNGNNFINGSSGYTSTYHTFTRTNFDQVDPGIIYTTTNDGAYNDQTTSFNWGNNWNAGTFLRTFDLSFLSHTRYQGCQNPIGGFAEGGGGEESRSMELIAAEEIATGEAFEQIPVDYKPVVQYEGEKRTFKKIDEEPSLADESYVLEDFYTEKETQAVGRMQRVRDAIKELADTIIVNDTLLYQTKLDRVRELKDEVSTTTNYEFNEKRLAEVYANTIAAGTPLYKDLDAKNFINWLAHQCVAQEGHAVYEARALYATINPNEDYDDDVLCAVAFKKEQEKVEEQQPETITMRLLPNPANAFVTLYYHLAEHDKAVFAVYNNLGEVVYETPLNANYFTQTVLTTGFVAGVYTYQVVLNGQAVKRDKFIVAH